LFNKKFKTFGSKTNEKNFIQKAARERKGDERGRGGEKGPPPPPLRRKA
tara:strand:- start:448 stop:594 length:147 start_codon:yes stop_codon:yes gene_type:complete